MCGVSMSPGVTRVRPTPREVPRAISLRKAIAEKRGDRQECLGVTGTRTKLSGCLVTATIESRRSPTPRHVVRGGGPLAPDAVACVFCRVALEPPPAVIGREADPSVQ